MSWEDDLNAINKNIKDSLADLTYVIKDIQNALKQERKEGIDEGYEDGYKNAEIDNERNS